MTNRDSIHQEDTSDKVGSGQLKHAQKLCRWCSSDIDANAKVCKICNKHQNRFLNYATHLNLIPAFVSLILVGLSIQQLMLANRQFEEAKSARLTWEQVRTRVDEDAKRISGIKSEMEDKYNQALVDQRRLEELANLYTLLIEAPYEIESLRKVKSFNKANNPKIRFIAERGLNRIIEEIKINQSRMESDLWGYKYYPDIFLGLKDTKDWGLSQYIDNYSKIAYDQRVVYVLKFLSDDKKDDVSKFTFSDFVLRKESRPDVIYTTCSFVNKKAGINKDYLFETDQYQKWLKSKI
jgi:hypothetical protein